MLKVMGKRGTTVGVALVFGVLGVILVFTSKAATPTATLEAESGVVSSAASSVTDTTASGVHVVKFGSASAACSGSANTPGGADPWGGCWPGPNNTGPPAGTMLTTYTGANDIRTCGVVIDSKIINTWVAVNVGNGTQSENTPCVTIRNSVINGTVGLDAGGASGPLILDHVEINAPTNTNTSTLLASNFFAHNVNIHGGAKGAIQCSGYCYIYDSWVHDFFLTGSSHYDGIGTNGLNGLPLDFQHTSIGCNFYNTDPTASAAGAGCSADVGLFGDFGTIDNVTANKNLFLASNPPNSPSSVGYCFDTNGSKPGKAYPTGTNIRVTSNVFQKGGSTHCGDYGPVADWAYNTGNIWTGNIWDDGTALNQ